MYIISVNIESSFFTKQHDMCLQSKQRQESDSYSKGTAATVENSLSNCAQSEMVQLLKTVEHQPDDTSENPYTKKLHFMHIVNKNIAHSCCHAV